MVRVAGQDGDLITADETMRGREPHQLSLNVVHHAMMARAATPHGQDRLVTQRLAPSRIVTAGYGEPMDDELMTVAEIAAILKLNPQTIRNWIDGGTLSSVRLGQRRVRVHRSDFNQLI